MSKQQFDPIVSASATEAESIIENTLLGVEPCKLLPGNVYAIRTKNGYELADLTKPDLLKAAGWERLNPQSGYCFHDVDSFTSYVLGVFSNKSNSPAEDVYQPKRNMALCMADESSKTIRLIFDAQPNKWGNVTADLRLQSSPEAQRWIGASGTYYAQQDFAEFCEINLETFSTPPAATILEIAQTFQATTTVVFNSAVRLASGAIKLRRDEKIEASAGRGADILIPEKLTLAMPLFKYGKTYAVNARLRYRLSEGAVKLSVLLVDPEMAIEHAFREVTKEVASKLAMPVFYGKV